MLEELSIKNVALIDELTLSFEQGMTVLTGETGAGKSIIIDAIGLLIGGRGSVDFVRHGTDRAEIEGLFYVHDTHQAKAKTEEAGIAVEEGMLVLRREVTHKGKSVCRVNGKLVTLAILREIGQSLIDIHGQHEHQELLQRERHLSFLDQFAGEEVEESKAEYQQLFKAFKQTKAKMKQLKENDQEQAHRLDLIDYQLKEITEANLQPGEDEELEQERYKLSNSEKLYEALHGAYNSLYGEGKGLDWASLALNHSEEAGAIDQDVKEAEESIRSSYYMLEEATYTLRDQIESLEFDPDRLHVIEARLNEIQHLKRKYGESVSEILEYAASIEEEYDSLMNRDERLQAYEEELEQLARDVKAEADTLSDLRKQAAKRLTEQIVAGLQSLYMENASLKVEFKPPERGETYALDGQEHTFTETGQEKVEFLISTNAGEPLKPLAKVASGGEISRIMLALKSVLSDFQDKVALIFDEVDTGVSGRVAQAIAEKIQFVARGSQVLCISHLPQVAARADQHLLIKKEEIGSRVLTDVSLLSREDQAKEVARMISGTEVTAASLENAKDLLQQASGND
ncbi:DNA repair protein RecN [Salsuginibacillus kocurii]|uniref:DNA repair protein RecN n=1 Tax=Salsuginibacillus kocurii TaxID=427078 RepID=UPI000381038B|nr:DNA repair protein RecN [Salsuginibacillus kocurii]